ncbi:MAG: hypothetical protein JW708_00265 [Vallitaleaceae bacterium]|nr:hypothetical protein [Vallitaleaceae bacterium]
MKAFFRKILAFLSSLHRRGYEEELVSGIDLEQLMKKPNRDELLREKMEENQSQEKEAKAEYDKIMDEYICLDRISKFEKDTKKSLQKLFRKYSEALVQKDEADKKLSETKMKQEEMGTFVKDIPKAIKILQEHEANQQKVKRDLSILEGEKTELHYQFKNLQRALVFLRYFMIFLAMVAFLVGSIIAIAMVKYRQDIFKATLIFIVVIFFLFLWIFVFRRYCIHELKKNQIMQERLVKLLNKTKIKYVRNQQVLDFEYEKYRVNDSMVLQMRYDNYISAKAEIRNHESIQSSLRTLISDIDRILAQAQLDQTDFVLKNADYLATTKGMHILLEQYAQKKAELLREVKQRAYEQEVLEKAFASLRY